MKKKLLGMGLFAGALGYGQPAAPPPPVGVRVERFEVGTAGPGGPMALSMGSEVSIEMTVVKGAPFSGEFVTESMQQLADGNRITSKRSEVYARDAEGRTRREMGPVTFIHDPVAKVDLILENQKKTARKITMPDLPTPPAGQNVLFLSTMAPPPGGPPPDVIKFVRTEGAAGDPAPFATKTEPLGKRMIEGTEAEGTRTTVTVPAGAVGNDLPLVTVSERWFSAELKTVVLSTRKDPRAGETTYRLTSLRKGEPSPHLFQLPPDFTLTAAGSNGPVILQRMRIDKKND
ncbi:MAG: hypothetical protein INH43_05520 [Acidobacteriaceae bacterium]|nr:hypothetical protein [Acidobacteriaceae bacterium]